MIQLIRGFKDILPGEVELWQYIEKTARSLFEDFGFKEIRIPIMERTELFARSIGEDTDIVEKEMYTFPDRKGSLITLRPEATASVCRSYIQHKLYSKDPVQKYFTIGPMFRRERPQKGRYRQFYQINAEIFGVDSPLVDVELIFLLVTLFSRLSVSDVEAHINSLGCPECRPKFNAVLSDFLTSSTGNLCSDCVRRKDRNPLRVLDCKVPACREAMAHAPSILDYLCPACSQHFETVKTALDAMNVPFTIDKRLVRGLDYYTRTTFEIQTGSLGAQSAVAGGGRYDGLVKALGGPDTPATGFAIGLDRLAEITGLNCNDFIKTPDIYLAALGEKSLSLAFEWKSALCLEGVKTEMDFGDKSLKSQMKRADRLGAKHVLIVGDNEIKQGSVILRNMTTKEQVTIPIEHVVENIKAKLRS
ncbi:MAG: histidine--tRNA ligase [Proteobacteria bacterium]|nr:histidine--tRNA ligase [Pseudomonadota bacterium]OEU61701.1 MAG: histidine--tRNA ligase [Desulfobacterales bacterium S5133MH16]